MEAVNPSLGPCFELQNKFSFGYDDDSKALIKKCSENITVRDIIDSWDGMICNCSLPEDTRGLVLDYSNAHLNFEVAEHQKIVDFYIKNLNFFNKYRIGVVANNPHNIVIIMLIARADERYLLRPFTTLRAALVWVRN
jgi:hypothetical protein